MKDEQKVFIRGVAIRGDEVINALKAVGGNMNRGNLLRGNDDQCIYMINHEGFIDAWSVTNEIAKIIMDNYRELHLPNLWKDGDILVTDEGFFSVFSGEMSVADYGGTNIITYCGVDEHQIWLSGCNKNTGRPHLATPSEVEHFHELLHKFGKDWDAENKQLVDWQWKPEIHECYFFVNSDLSVLSTPNDGPLIDLDAARIRRGNCFRTQREAKKNGGENQETIKRRTTITTFAAMKQRIKIEGKNINDLFALPCVRSITKTSDGPVTLKVKLAVCNYEHATIGDWLVEDDNGNWHVEKGGEQ